jgi:hypothetical protein
MDEMTHFFGEAIGKDDLHYIQFSYEDAKLGLTEAELSQDVARALVELNQSMNEGIFSEGITRTFENQTETSFEEFAKTFAKVYENS